METRKRCSFPQGEKAGMRASQTTHFPILPARYCPKWSFEFIRQVQFQGAFTGFIFDSIWTTEWPTCF
jgi:hypothetical protein